MDSEVTETVIPNSEPKPAPNKSTPAKKKKKTAAKKKPAKKSKKKPAAKRKKAANFTFKGPGGARERKKLGIHLLIIRVPVSVVKRIDAKLKKAGQTRGRGEWCAHVLTTASKR